MSITPRPITIQYRRLPNRIATFRGRLLEETRNRLVIEQRVHVAKPRREFGKVVVDDGFLVVWFIFRGRWFDIGKFYDRKGMFTGYYCDIVRPVARLLSGASRTSVVTDLFLDLWISPEGRIIVLDEDEFEHAVAKRIIPPTIAATARRELRSLVRMSNSGRFPSRWIREFQPSSKMTKPLENSGN